MSRVTPLRFQGEHIEALLERFRALKQRYDVLGPTPKPAQWDQLRKASACVMLQAPTGIGKTLMASEVLSRFSLEEKILWFWFAPFSGVVEQTRAALKTQTPNLVHLDVQSDRKAVQLEPGAIFVLTWQTVANSNKEGRRARKSGDEGLSVDALIEVARQEGYRIGTVVDEAHHTFLTAAESVNVFTKVLQPDYVLMMTATPRDADVAEFSKKTSYQVGDSSEWATVPRQEGVDAELLKVSVKTVRFITRNTNDAQLLEFEEVAMSECAVMHRHLKQTLKDAGIDVVPLMLVQVPNGDEAVDKAVKYLVEQVGFDQEAVRKHVSKEPDPNLMAMARDPKVEVIVFKMAIATGFDAPRAFTLAALRGARDKQFGVQVVGRIMRVHRLLQGRMKTVAPVLRYGYVYLANTADQEGLRAAADQINKVSGHLADASVSTVVTFIDDQPQVQVVKEGENLSLLAGETAETTDGSEDDSSPSSGHDDGTQATDGQKSGGAPKEQTTLFDKLTAGTSAHGFSTDSKLTSALELDAQPKVHRYVRKDKVPTELISERLPKAAEDIEARLVTFIDFAPVLGDRLRKKTKLTKRTEDVFSGDEPDDADSFQNMSAERIAEKARQIAFAFDDTDRRELLKALKDRFRECLTNEGHEVPTGDEELTRQLELVLVRNDQLMKNAYKRLRAEQVREIKVQLPTSYETVDPWPPAKRNTHGVFPPSMGEEDEFDFAMLLDTEPEIEWWYRNLPGKERTDNVGLYSWSGGTGFYPDFVVKVKGRTEGDGVVLVEVKGPLREKTTEKVKAAATHPKYGRVMMVSRNSKKAPFRFYRLVQQAEGEPVLVDDGPFEVQRLRHS